MLNRFVGIILFGLIGWGTYRLFGTGPLWAVVWPAAGAIIGAIAMPSIAQALRRWLHSQMGRIPPEEFVAGLIGLVAGLAVSAIVALPLSLFPGLPGKVLPAVAALVITYVGVFMATARSQAVASILASRSASQPLGSKPEQQDASSCAVVDTSAIIDGRIADIARAGFAPGILVIPKFVLEELQYIADSSDSLRRQRGRRGLEMLNKLQKEAAVPVEISEADFKDADGVDAKLVRMAKATGYPIVTNDFGLNRVAELQGVRVLNINQLAASVRPLILPGEEVEIRIIQEGKEFGQGVGFLDDGTMVVVEEGRRHLNSRVDVVVTRVLQTAVGRMIFAQVKNGASRDRTPRPS